MIYCIRITRSSKSQCQKIVFISVQKQKEISRNSQKKKKKMTGFQQKAWLSNDKKGRKKVQLNEIVIQLAFLLSDKSSQYKRGM